MQATLGKRLTVTFIKSLSSSRVTLCRKNWEYIRKSPFSAKICSDISPWTLSVTRRDQFSKGEAEGKPTLTNWLLLYYQLELEEQIFVFWSSLIHMKTSYPFYRKNEFSTKFFFQDTFHVKMPSFGYKD